jgi:hypothetical protein
LNFQLEARVPAPRLGFGQHAERLRMVASSFLPKRVPLQLRDFGAFARRDTGVMMAPP